ncbi:beta-carboxysome assembly chaperone CcmS [Trichormus azollae]|uniref:beta-carboxysome assembly chaperone CcmS n=1 Tax=Trichormus azollae TaxID=1164 RepID=UPI00325DAD5D
MFSGIQPEKGDNKWRRLLDKFVKANQPELAALFWGLWLENGDTKGTIGIDLQPQPHFVYCPKEAVKNLNERVENRLQELLGIIENNKPEMEVLMIGIGKGEIKLIQFAPEPSPQVCFEQVGKDLDSLLESLEERIIEQIIFNTESR